MKHWGWGGHSGKKTSAHGAHPVPAGQGGSGSLGGRVGRTSRIRGWGGGTRRTPLLARWSPKPWAALERPSSRPSPHATCSPPALAVGTTLGNFEAS